MAPVGAARRSFRQYYRFSAAGGSGFGCQVSKVLNPDTLYENSHCWNSEPQDIECRTAERLNACMKVSGTIKAMDTYSRLKDEISHTDSHDYREFLKERKEVLVKLREQLH